MSRALWRLATAFLPEYRRFAGLISDFARQNVRQARTEVQKSLYQYLVYCRTYSPYWRERWPKEAWDFGPSEADDVLRLLPPLSKTDLRDFQDQLRILPQQRRSNDGFPSIRKQSQVRSGGSTGVPVAVTIDAGYSARNRATYDFFYRLCGLEPGAPFFYIWGSPNELVDLRHSWKKRLSSWLRGMQPIPAFALSPERIIAVRDQIERNRHINSAVCFATAAETIVEYAERSSISFRRIERAFTGGGLLHDRLRALLHKHLSHDVFNSYASRDLGMIAHETPAHDGLSVAEWFNKVEVLAADKQRVNDGAVGEVHVTALNNYSHALVRVAMGDTARWHSAAGNNSLPVPRLLDLAGRTVEQLIGPGGVVIDPSAVIHLVGVVIAPAWLRKFQLVQRSSLRYELRVESWDGTASEAQVDELRLRLQQELSHLVAQPIQLSATLVAEIAPLPSGKHQYCRSEPDGANGR
jgi:phenylacetate-coenzyme A ligase PaaK-like adenylate-forming protein